MDLGLKLLSTSQLRELSSMENNVSLHFQKKEDENFPGSSAWNMEKNRGMWLIEDNLQWSELDPGDEISRVSRGRKRKYPPRKCPDLW